MKTVGYVRVSSKDQNEDRQLETMKQYSVDRVFHEKLSGKNMERPELKKALEYSREGDKFIVAELSRLGRSVTDLHKIVDELTEKGVTFCSVKENIDLSTPTGKLMFGLLAVLAQYERELLLERQYEGILIAKRDGKYKGRQPVKKPANFDKVIKLVTDGEITAVEGMKRTGLKKSVFYQFYKQYKTTDDYDVIEI